MTYQQSNPNHHDTTNEASSLFLTVAGGGGVSATKKKNGGVPRRVMIVTTCFFLVTLAVIYGGRGSSSSSSSDHAPAATTTTWNKDVLLVGVHEEDQVEGARCCPGDWDGCHSFFDLGAIWGEHYCNDVGKGFIRSNKWKDLGNGTVCHPRIGGHCCGHETYDHYSWRYINVGGCTGCCKDSF